MRLLTYFYIISVLLGSFSVIAQEPIDSYYGLDPLIYNGQFYTYLVPLSVQGHQYFETPDYQEGILIIKGKEYTGLKINYDILDQEVLLKFKVSQRTVIIKLNKEKIEAFKIGDNNFKIIRNSNNESIIYQYFGKDRCEILVNWRKTLNLSNISGEQYFVFSSRKREMFLELDNRFSEFRNKRTFVSIIDPKEKEEVKKFLKQNNINLKKATDLDFYSLAKFLNEIQIENYFTFYFLIEYSIL